MSMKAKLSLLVAALFALPYISPEAQVLYKSTMPDGKVIFSDKPAPGAVKVEASRPDTSRQGVAPPSKGEAATL